MNDLILYTKFCVKCVALEDYQYLQEWCFRNNKRLIVERTTYRPKAHELASCFWGDDKYTMFVRDNSNGNNVEFHEFVKRIKDLDAPKTIKKAKPVKEGKKK